MARFASGRPPSASSPAVSSVHSSAMPCSVLPSPMSSARMQPQPPDPRCPVTQSNMNDTPSRWCGRSHLVSMLSTTIGEPGEPAAGAHSTSGSMPSGSASGACGDGGGASGRGARGSDGTWNGLLSPHGTKTLRAASLRRSACGWHSRNVLSLGRGMGPSGRPRRHVCGRLMTRLPSTDDECVYILRGWHQRLCAVGIRGCVRLASEAVCGRHQRLCAERSELKGLLATERGVGHARTFLRTTFGCATFFVLPDCSKSRVERLPENAAGP
eukprot:357052-Chlamydomonas_euryale.AAC.1